MVSFLCRSASYLVVVPDWRSATCIREAAVVPNQRSATLKHVTWGQSEGLTKTFQSVVATRSG